MKKLEEKLNNNRLGNGRVQEEEEDQLWTGFLELVNWITLSIGGDDILDF
jgi:hypothetical protein